MKNEFDVISNIGKTIRNSGKTLKEKDNMAYEWAQNILNSNSSDYLIRFAKIIVEDYKNKYLHKK